MRRLPADFKHPLTPVQVAILRLVANGKENSEIARLLGISADTVKNHMSITFEKLGATHRAHAVALAWTYGYLASEDIQEGTAFREETP